MSTATVHQCRKIVHNKFVILLGLLPVIISKRKGEELCHFVLLFLYESSMSHGFTHARALPLHGRIDHVLISRHDLYGENNVLLHEVQSLLL